MKENPGEEDQAFFDRQKAWQKFLLIVANLFGATVAIQFIELHQLSAEFRLLIPPIATLVSWEIVKVINKPISQV